MIEEGQKERKRSSGPARRRAARIAALALNLKLLERRLADPEARAQLDDAQREVDLSLAELRDLARGIHPAVVTGQWLAVALEQVAARAPLPVRLSVDKCRLPEPVEVAAYYVVTESLTNVAKHAQASRVAVTIGRADGGISVEIVDDGVGGADSERGSACAGSRDRVEALAATARLDADRAARAGGDPVRVAIAEDSVLLRDGSRGSSATLATRSSASAVTPTT